MKTNKGESTDPVSTAAEDDTAPRRPRTRRKGALPKVKLPRVSVSFPRDLEGAPPKPDYVPDSISAKDKKKLEREAKRQVEKEAKKRRAQATDKWNLKEVLDHVTFTKNGKMQAWYLLDPQRWAFQSVQSAEELIEEHARRYADLVNYSFHLRVTSRPFPIKDAANAAFDNAPDPTEGFTRILERDHDFFAGTSNDDKLVYIGVEFGRTPQFLHTAGRYLKSLREKLAAVIESRVTRLDSIMADDGMEAVPAIGNDMAWLLARSFGLGCPSPLPTSGRSEWKSEDLAEFIAGVRWTQDPLGPLRVDSVRGDDLETAFVQILSIGDMHDMAIPEDDVPWIAKAEQLPFNVEWSGHVTVIEPEKTRQEMERQIDKITGQVEHYTVDHDKTPPKQLARQEDLAEDVEDEMRVGMRGLSTRTKGQYRVAIYARSEDELKQRVREFKDFYEPGIYPQKTLGSYKLAKEFVPGHFPETNDFVHRLKVTELAAAMPAATSEVGDKRGILLAKTAGLSERLVAFDPWFLPEVAERSGLVPICGTLGSGKSSLSGIIIYKTVHSGVPWSVLDPSGRLTKLARMEDMRGLAREVNLLNSAAGTLNPYALVPDPQLEWFLEDEDDPHAALEKAIQAAKSQRRSLVIDNLKAALPPKTLSSDDAEELLRNAIFKTSATRSTVLDDVMHTIRETEGETKTAVSLLNRMEELKEHELGRLFFGEHGERESDEMARMDYRLQIYSLKGMARPGQEQTDPEEWSTEERLSRPIMALASWATSQMIYRADPNERKGVALDEAHEITAVSSGRQLTQKVATDTRKHNVAAIVSTQNAGAVLGTDVNNFVGATFVGRTEGEDEQRDALKMLRLSAGVGYEEDLAKLSPKPRRGQTDRESFDTSYREYIFSDGVGGMEKIKVETGHHPELADALDTTPDRKKTRRARTEEDDAA